MCWAKRRRAKGSPVSGNCPWPRWLAVRFSGISLAAALAAVSVSAFASPAARPVIGPWRTVPGPAVPAADSANLTGLAMAGPSEGWACGFTLNNASQVFGPLLAAWNGHDWRTIRVSLGLGVGGRLDGLAVRSAADAWAVGTAYPNSGTGQALIMHWNGRRWARLAAPSVPGWQETSLLSVAAHSVTDAWAVGEAVKPGGLRPVIEHWDGHGWRLMASPPVPPMTALGGVTAAADGEAWTVGTPFRSTGRGVVLRWTRHAWAAAPTPKTGGIVAMEGVSALSPENVWAVGTAVVGSGPYRVYALHWDGHQWTPVAVPHDGQADSDWGFQSVASVGHGDLVAVGAVVRTGAPGSALYGIWSGGAWSISSGPRTDVDLGAVSFDGRHAIWAVGSATTSSQTFRPVVQVSEVGG